MNQSATRKVQLTVSKRTLRASLSLQAMAMFLTFYMEGSYLATLSDLGPSIWVNIGWTSVFCAIIIFTIKLITSDYLPKSKSKKSASMQFYRVSVIISAFLLSVYAFFVSELNALQGDAFGQVVVSIVAVCIMSAPASLLFYFMPEKASLKREKEKGAVKAAKEEKKKKEDDAKKLNPNARRIISRTTWISAWVVQELLTVFCFISLMAFAGDFSTFNNVRFGILSSYPSLIVSFILMLAPLYMGVNYTKDKKTAALRWFVILLFVNAAVLTLDFSGSNVEITLEAVAFFSMLYLAVSIPSTALLYFMPGKGISTKEAKQQVLQSIKKQRENSTGSRDMVYATLWDNFVGFQDAPVKLYGQEKTEAMIAKSIKSYDESDGKPLSLLFCGASGVGKTQMVENLAVANNMPYLQFNMPEYGGGTSTNGGDMAKDKLLGMPAGYTDSERGGLLTNSLLKFPTAIYLFDEMEKAAPSVYDIFLNALDKGFIDDARGNRVDCSKATFIFTTNIARDVDPELEDAKIRDKMVREGFRPELVGRLHKAIVFRPLSEKIAGMVAKNELVRSLKKMAERYEMSAPTITWQPEALALRASIGGSGYEKYGVRVISKTMKELAVDILNEYQAKKAKNGVVLYPTKHGVPGRKALSGGMSFAVGKGQSIDTEALFKGITKNVKGQDHAVTSIIEQIKLREMGLVAKKEQPEGTYLFTGPSGTGKSELVKQLASHLDRKFIFFNMGNFKGENGIEAFFGPPPGYVGSEDGGQLTNAILDNPDAIILLDEIEKANPKIWDAFMSVFDDGIAKDNSTGETVSFKNTMIFMTSNLVTEDIPQSQTRDYLRGTDYFRPEMINRIENIVSFKPLGDEVKGDIVAKILAKVLENYNQANGTDVSCKQEWLDRFTSMADFTHGARDIQRMIQKELAKELL